MEPTNSLTKAELDTAAAVEMGFSRTSTDWDDDQAAMVDEVVKMAQRRVYFTEANPQLGIPAGYKWTFLKPVATLTLPSGSKYLDLPDDFGGLEGMMSVAQSGETGFWPIPQISEPQIRVLHANDTESTGEPQCVAVEQRPGTTATEGQRARLVVFPTSDAAYTLQCQYYLTPGATSGSRPYPYGGSQHAELFHAAVLACVEFKVHGMIAERDAYFMRRLATSVEIDQRNREQTLGRVVDNSDGLHYRDRLRRRDGTSWGVLFNGVEYE